MPHKPVEPGQDQRGAVPGSRAGTPHEGKSGNLPHERKEEAAKLITELCGYGMPIAEIATVLNRTFGGFSESTIRNHYSEELEAGMAEKKTELLRFGHNVALMKDTPKGVSVDTAFREANNQLRWLLAAVHRVSDGAKVEFGAGTINVSIGPDDAEL